MRPDSVVTNFKCPDCGSNMQYRGEMPNDFGSQRHAFTCTNSNCCRYQLCNSSTPESITQHRPATQEERRQVYRILIAKTDEPTVPEPLIVTAAVIHDLGRRHPVFLAMDLCEIIWGDLDAVFHPEDATFKDPKGNVVGKLDLSTCGHAKITVLQYIDDDSVPDRIWNNEIVIGPRADITRVKNQSDTFEFLAKAIAQAVDTFEGYTNDDLQGLED